MSQQMPKPGQNNVTPVARDAFLRMLADREAEGIAKYGATLQTHNGRDPLLDAMEEIIDAWQYVVQASMERDGGRWRHVSEGPPPWRDPDGRPELIELWLNDGGWCVGWWAHDAYYTRQDEGYIRPVPGVTHYRRVVGPRQ